MKKLSCIVLFILLAACSGGNSGKEPSPVSTNPTPTPSPVTGLTVAKWDATPELLLSDGTTTVTRGYKLYCRADGSIDYRYIADVGPMTIVALSNIIPAQDGTYYLAVTAYADQVESGKSGEYMITRNNDVFSH